MTPPVILDDADIKVKRTTTAEHWDRVGEDWQTLNHDNPALAGHKRRVYAGLLDAWLGSDSPSRALKTDMFAEAFNDEEFVSGMAWKDRMVGIDISSTILQGARKRRGIGPLGGWVTCDVTSLPFRDGAFDLVISDSTLDHFGTEGEILVALEELTRVLAHRGRLIVSIDNPASLTYPPRWVVRLWMRLGLAPYFIGVTLSAARLRHALESLGMTVTHQTAILHYPHPDGLVRFWERSSRAIGRGRLDGFIADIFRAAEKLGNTRLRYLSGRYLAMNAMKDGQA